MNKTYTNRILGLDIAVTNPEDAAALIRKQADAQEKLRVVLVTVDDLLEAQKDAEKCESIRNAQVVLPVSEPIAWIQRLRGFKTAEAINEGRLRERLADLIEAGRVVIESSGTRRPLSYPVFLLKCIPDAFRWQKKQEDDKKDLLIYAHYYYPDVASTGQILTDLAEGLGETFHTTVICTVPSYTGVIDKHYKQHKYYYENIGGVDVLRIRVPEFRKNFSPSRIINILSYFFGAIWATFRVGHQDYIYTISQPPVLGAMLGVLGKWIKHGKLIYNIQDFNPEQVQAVSFTNNRLILGTMMFLDKFACRRADRIVIVGRDMIETLKKRFPKETPGYALINNWIDEKEIVPLPDTDERVLAFREKYGLGGKLVIMYSGNIGLYYDLLEIEKIAASYRDRTDVVFAFVGQGSVLEEMQAYKEREKAENICFIPYQDKMDLVYSLNAGDVHLVANARGIKGVSVPSKLYGVMAVGKPVLGILEEGAEARIIVEEADCGKVVAPGDYDGVRRLIDFFTDEQNRGELAEMGRRGRNFLDANLTREISIRKYADEMLALK